MDKFLDAIINFFKSLFKQYNIEPKDTVSEKGSITHIPVFGEDSTAVETIQKALKVKGYNIVVDRDFGPKTRAEISKFQKDKGLAGSGILGPKTIDLLGLKVVPPKHSKKAPWFWELKKYEGKVETDPAFNKEMSAKWKLVGLDLGTISKSWAAWCGLFIAVGLSGVGYQWQKDGAAAKNWAKYGNKIEWKVNGFPQGAIIHINHKAKCTSGSSNHVTLANGDCSAKDLNKSGARFSGYGGNQGNTAKVSSYPVKNICAVVWPKEQPLPGKVEVSDNCSNGKTNDGESTR